MGLCKYVISTIKQSFENRCLILLLDAYNLSIIENRYSVDWLENDFTETLDYYIAKSPKRIKWNISNHTEQHLHNETQVEKGFATSSVDFGVEGEVESGTASGRGWSHGW